LKISRAETSFGAFLMQAKKRRKIEHKAIDFPAEFNKAAL